MACDWIKIEHVTPDKPEVFQLADALEIDPDAVVGKLIRVWIWADQQTTDGNAPSVTKTLLDRLSSVTGFAQAMIDTGWLQSTESGLRFSNFDRHNGETAKKRGQTLKRVRKHRNAESVTKSVTEALPEKEKEKEKEKRKKCASFDARSLDLPFDDPDFRQAWLDWCEHRKAKRSPLTEQCARRQLKDMAGWGLNRAISALDYTMRQGWTGIREPDPETNGSHKSIKELIG